MMAHATPNSETNGILRRVRRFLEKPFHEQSRTFYTRWRKLFPTVPIPVRLSFGAWFLGRNDYLGSTLTFDGFEPNERAFVQNFLKPGMTVIDIGAHHGFYTLLASKIVGTGGKVFAFEPSPRERSALRFNLSLNRCKNVVVQDLALGSQDGEATLHVVDHQTGCNSLRPPAADVSQTWKPTRVQVRRLDGWLDRREVSRVDFIKLDVEGGELEVLKGATLLLGRHPRPAILAELEDARSESWGYRAKDTAAHLQNIGFDWFRILQAGTLEQMSDNSDRYEGNYVALPKERIAELAEFTHNGSRS